MGRQRRGWGASCQAAARRLREVGDVVIVQDPEAGLGVEDLYQVREHERRLGAHVHDEPTGRDRPQREPDATHEPTTATAPRAPARPSPGIRLPRPAEHPNS